MCPLFYTITTLNHEDSLDAAWIKSYLGGIIFVTGTKCFRATRTDADAVL